MFGRMPQSGARKTLALVLALALLLAACSPGPDDAVAEANALFEAGKVEEAIDRLREAAAKDPANSNYQLAIGLTLLQLGRVSEAIFPLSKAADAEEPGGPARLVLASTLLGMGNLEEAIAVANQALEADPEEEAALVVRANAAIQLHRGEIALESAERLLVLKPDSVGYLHIRALALARLDRLDEAETRFLELMETPGEEAPEAAARACIALAGVFLEAKEEQRAVERLQTCDARFGEQPEVAMQIVRLYDRLERAEDSIDLLLRAIELAPDVIRLRTALGTRLIAADRFDEAEQIVSEGLDESPQRWAAVAAVRTAAGDLEEALEAIDQAIAASGSPVQEYLFRRADLLVHLGDVPAAEEILSAQLTEPLYVRTILARIAQAQGNPQQALELFETVIPQWPGNYALRVFAARAALELGDRERAKSALLEATRQAPKESDAAIWLARMQFADGEYREAAFMAIRQVTERGPTRPDGFILAARAYTRIGQPRAGRDVLARLFEAREGLFEADAVAELGRMQAQSQGAEEALGSYEELIAERELDLTDPASEPALAQLLQLLSDANQLDVAKSRLDRFLADHPERPLLHAMKGRVALLLGDQEAASAAFDRALDLDPELPAGLAGRALVLRSNGDLVAAAEAVDRAWKLGRHPDYGYMAGRLQLDMGHGGEASTRFTELLRLHPDHAPAANDLAWLLAVRGENLEQAQELAEMAVRLAPGAEVFDTLGYVQLKRGDSNAAIGSFRRAVDAQPDYATAHYHLALALRDGGRAEEARASLEAALETAFPESEQARALLVKLEGAEGAAQ